VQCKTGRWLIPHFSRYLARVACACLMSTPTQVPPPCMFLLPSVAARSFCTYTHPLSLLSLSPLSPFRICIPIPIYTHDSCDLSSHSCDLSSHTPYPPPPLRFVHHTHRTPPSPPICSTPVMCMIIRWDAVRAFEAHGCQARCAP
jgi:hypothetical protein